MEMPSLSSSRFFCFSAILCVIILSLVQSAYSIECYECNSKTNSNCSLKVPPPELLKDCSKNADNIMYTMCRKITQSIDFEVNGLQPDYRIIRSCAYEANKPDVTKDCYQRSGFGGRQEVCTCSENKCNGSTALKYSISILFLSTFAFYGLSLLTHS